MYCAGNNIVVYSTEDKSQFFYSSSSNMQGITCMCVSPQKQFIAVCQKDSMAGATWSIFDVKIQAHRRS